MTKSKKKSTAYAGKEPNDQFKGSIASVDNSNPILNCSSVAVFNKIGKLGLEVKVSKFG